MATYYVTQAGSGTADGTSYTNSASVATFNANTMDAGLAAGDTVYLCDNITSTIIPNSSVNGAAGNHIVIRGDYTDHAGIITSAASFGVNTNYRNYYTYQNLTFKDCALEGIFVRQGGHHITVKDCTAEGCAEGISVHTTYAVIIENCVVRNNTTNGIIVNGSASCTISNCTLSNNGTTGAASNTDQLLTVDTNFDSTGTYCGTIIIENCTCSGGLGTESSDFDIGRATDATVTNCISLNPDGKSFSVTGNNTTNVAFYNCIGSNGNRGFFLYGNANTIIKNCTIADAVLGIKLGVSAGGDDTVANITNSIFSGTSESLQAIATEFTLTENNNCLYGSYSGITADASDLQVDPELGTNYMPIISSPVVGAGAYPISTYDAYNRAKVGNGYHIGAVWPEVNTSKDRREG